MTVEQIVMRQEIRQMLNEAGINKNTLKEMVKLVLKEEIEKACMQAINEKDVNSIIQKKIDNRFGEIVKSATKEAIQSRIFGMFNRMTVSVDITDENGTSSITR